MMKKKFHRSQRRKKEKKNIKMNGTIYHHTLKTFKTLKNKIQSFLKKRLLSLVKEQK